MNSHPFRFASRFLPSIGLVGLWSAVAAAADFQAEPRDDRAARRPVKLLWAEAVHRGAGCGRIRGDPL